MITSVAPMRLPAALTLAALLASGCGGIVKQSYREIPVGAGTSLAPFGGATQVYASLDLADDGVRLARDGFARIGVSSFRTSAHVTLEELQEQAREVGADVVLFSKAKPGTGQVLQPLASSSDGTARALTPYSHVTSSITPFGGKYGDSGSVGGGMMDFKGSVTSSGIPGVSSEDLAAMNAEQFAYTATFWRKLRRGN
jgi:hypothetical protein